MGREAVILLLALPGRTRRLSGICEFARYVMRDEYLLPHSPVDMPVKFRVIIMFDTIMFLSLENTKKY